MAEDRPPELKLLYVEDDVNTREEIVTFLRRRNYHLMVAGNGRQGFELYLEHKPDIVISDIMMPEMDGLEMIRAVKNDNPAVPAILITAYSDTAYLLKAIEFGVDRYVLKPVEMGKLLQAIEKCSECVLNRRAMQACQDERERLITELQDALHKVKMLSREINESVDIGKKPLQEISGHKQSFETFPEINRKTEANHSAHEALPKQQQNSSEEIRQRILAQLDKTVLPYLDLLRQSAENDNSMEYIDLITAHLRSVGESFVQKLSTPNLGLTRREILVADLVRQGKNTIEIAGLLGLMPRSVESYRNRIRKKLCLNNQKINLQQYLRSLFTPE